MLRCRTLFFSALIASILFFISSPVLAGNTSGVPHPTLVPFEKNFTYRFGYSPEENGRFSRTLHRFQYEHSFAESSRWRVIAMARDVNDELEYDELRVQYLWLADRKPGSNRQSAYRVDLRTRNGDRPEQASFIWTNRWALNSLWSFTGVVIGHWQFGGDANPGTRAEVRTSINCRLSETDNIALESFNDFGDVSELSGFDAQRHSAGVFYSKRLGAQRLNLGYLAGLTSNTPDHAFRVWWTYRL